MIPPPIQGGDNFAEELYDYEQFIKRQHSLEKRMQAKQLPTTLVKQNSTISKLFSESLHLTQRAGDAVWQTGHQLQRRKFTKGGESPNFKQRVYNAVKIVIGGALVSAASLVVEESALLLLAGGAVTMALGVGMFGALLYHKLTGKNPENEQPLEEVSHLAPEEIAASADGLLLHQDLDERGMFALAEKFSLGNFLNDAERFFMRFHRRTPDQHPSSPEILRQQTEENTFSFTVRGHTFRIPEQFKKDFHRSSLTIDGKLFELTHHTEFNYEQDLQHLIETLQKHNFSDDQIEKMFLAFPQTAAVDQSTCLSAFAMSRGFLLEDYQGGYEIAIDTSNQTVAILTEKRLSVPTDTGKFRGLGPFQVAITYQVKDNTLELVEHRFACKNNQLNTNWETIDIARPLAEEAASKFGVSNVSIPGYFEAFDEGIFEATFDKQLGEQTKKCKGYIEVVNKEGRYQARLIANIEGEKPAEAKFISDPRKQFEEMSRRVSQLDRDIPNFGTVSEESLRHFERNIDSFREYIHWVKAGKQTLSIKKQIQADIPFYSELDALEAKVNVLQKKVMIRRGELLKENLDSLKFDVLNVRPTPHAVEYRKMYHTVAAERHKLQAAAKYLEGRGIDFPQEDQSKLLSDLALELSGKISGVFRDEVHSLKRSLRDYENALKERNLSNQELVALYKKLKEQAVSLRFEIQQFSIDMQKDYTIQGLKRIDAIEELRENITGVNALIDRLTDPEKAPKAEEFNLTDESLAPKYKEAIITLHHMILKASNAFRTAPQNALFEAIDMLTTDMLEIEAEITALKQQLENDETLTLGSVEVFEFYLGNILQNYNYLELCKQETLVKHQTTNSFTDATEKHQQEIAEELQALGIAENPRGSLSLLRQLADKNSDDASVVKMREKGRTVYQELIRPQADPIKRLVCRHLEELLVTVRPLLEERGIEFIEPLEEKSAQQLETMLKEIAPLFEESAFSELKESLLYNIKTLKELEKFERFAKGEDVAFENVDTPPIEFLFQKKVVEILQDLEGRQLLTPNA